jgi:hypothetical protein
MLFQSHSGSFCLDGLFTGDEPSSFSHHSMLHVCKIANVQENVAWRFTLGSTISVATAWFGSVMARLGLVQTEIWLIYRAEPLTWSLARFG